MERNRHLVFLLSMSALFFSILSLGNFNITGSIIADEVDLVKETNDYNKDASDKRGLFDKLFEDKDASATQKRDKIGDVLMYLFKPGSYMEDVTRYVEIEKNDNTTVQDRDGKKTICYFNDEPQNLLNHNCDLPALGTAFIQQFSTQTTGIQNGARTASKSLFGIPDGIPNNEVSEDENKRSYKFTGLELFGYNLQFSSYAGEWDEIQVSTAARVMSNFGFWDSAKLAGTSIWNGVKAGINSAMKSLGDSVANFDFEDLHPKNWLKGVGDFIKGATDAIDAGAAGAFWTLVDTSDYNVAATHSWLRPEFAATTYNAYYMTAKEVNDKLDADITILLRAGLGLSSDPKAQHYKNTDFTRKDLPKFRYRKTKTGEVDEEGKPVYKTEEEELKEWLDSPEMASVKESLAALEINCDSSTQTEGSWKQCVSSSWGEKLSKEMSEDDGILNHYKTVFAMFIKQIAEEKRYQSNRSLSRWICADEEGKPTSPLMEEWKYIYEKENTRTSESLTAGCAKVRPSIKGGLLGTGDGKSTDTRWVLYDQLASSNQVKTITDNGSSFSHNAAILFTQISNTLINLAYGNILEQLGITKIVESLIVSFRDGLFYPLSVLLATSGAVWLLAQLFIQGSAMNVIKGIGLIFLAFFVGAMLMNKPATLIKLIEEYPSKIDNAVAGLLFDNGTYNDDTLCSATGGDKNNIRTMQCKVWEISLFNAWSFGQWGTSYKNLESSAMSNSNQDLVGDASYNMGGGIVSKNWAIYQLSKMKTGTITNNDPTKATGVTSKALYKIVDLQFGPNNGAASDSRYAMTWAGVGAKRGQIKAKSAVTAFAVMFVIGGFAIHKIELTLIFAMLLVGFPFMFLVGLFPTGKAKLKSYLEKLTSIFIRRIIITFLMSLALLMMAEGANAVENYNILFVYTLLMAVAFKFYYKEMINLLSVAGHTSSMFISDQVGGLREKIKQQQILPKSVNQIVRRNTSRARDTAIGGTVGAAYGVIAMMKRGIEGDRTRMTTTNPNTGKQYRTNPLMESIKQGMNYGNITDRRMQNKNLREGLNIYSKAKRAQQAVDSGIERDFINKKDTINHLTKITATELNTAKIEFKALQKEFNKQFDYLERLSTKNNWVDENGKITPPKENNLQYERTTNNLNYLYNEMMKKNEEIAKLSVVSTMFDEAKEKNYLVEDSTFYQAMASFEKDTKNQLKSASENFDEFVNKASKYIEEKPDDTENFMNNIKSSISTAGYSMIDNFERERARKLGEDVPVREEEFPSSPTTSNSNYKQQSYQNREKVRNEAINQGETLKVIKDKLPEISTLEREDFLTYQQDKNNPNIMKNKLSNLEESFAQTALTEVAQATLLGKTGAILNMVGKYTDKELEKDLLESARTYDTVNRKASINASGVNKLADSMLSDYYKGVKLEKERPKELHYLDERKYTEAVKNKTDVGKYYKQDNGIILSLDNYDKKSAIQELEIQKLNKEAIERRIILSGGKNIEEYNKLLAFMDNLQLIADGKIKQEKNRTIAKHNWESLSRNDRVRNQNIQALKRNDVYNSKRDDVRVMNFLLKGNETRNEQTKK